MYTILATKLSNISSNMGAETYIIADSAYPLQTYLIKAFPHHDMLGHRENRFNKILSSTRMIVEQAFGLLKG